MSQSRYASAATIEGRLERLEHTVDVLSEALRVLAHGAEGGPLAEPGTRAPRQAARQAYEMMLTLQQGEVQDADGN